MIEWLKRWWNSCGAFSHCDHMVLKHEDARHYFYDFECCKCPHKYTLQKAKGG